MTKSFLKKFLSPDIHCIVQQTPSLINLLFSNLTLKPLLRFPLSRYLELGLQKYNLILNCQMFFNKILNPLPAVPLSYYLHLTCLLLRSLVSRFGTAKIPKYQLPPN